MSPVGVVALLLVAAQIPTAAGRRFPYGPGGLQADAARVVIVVEQRVNRVAFFDPETGARLGAVAVGFMPHEIALSSEGTTAYVSNFGLEDYDHAIGTPGTSVSVIDVAAMVEKFRISTTDSGPRTDASIGGGRAPHGVSLRPPLKRELYANLEDGDRMLVFDAGSGRRLRAFPVPAGVHNFVFAADGESAFLMAGANGVYRIDAESGTIEAHWASQSPVRGLCLGADGTSLIAAGRGEVSVLSQSTLAVQRSYVELTRSQIVYGALTPDGHYYLAPASEEGAVLVLDLQSGSIIKRIPTGKVPIAVVVDDSVAYVSNTEDDHVTAIDLTNLTGRVFAEAHSPNRIVIGQRAPKSIGSAMRNALSAADLSKGTSR